MMMNYRVYIKSQWHLAVAHNFIDVSYLKLADLSWTSLLDQTNKLHYSTFNFWLYLLPWHKTFHFSFVLVAV